MSEPASTIVDITPTTTPTKPGRVLLVYNTDYDEELKAASPVDVSAVQTAALAVCGAARDHGLTCEVMGLEGPDLDRLVARLRDDPPDLVFNLCESLSGDTRNELLVPAVLELFRVPYTGPGPLPLGLCLDKGRAKQVLLQAGVPTPPYRVVRSPAQLTDPADPLGLDRLEYPFFCKLLREDASIGIDASNRVADRAALCRRVGELLAEHRQPVLLERYIEGREVNVAVLGNGEEARVLPLFEIDFARLPPGRPRILTYAAKWDERHVDYIGTIPVPVTDLAPEVEREIGRVALAGFEALGLADFGRVDVRVDAAGVPWVIDVNPNCDLSPDAGFARTALSAGLDYPHVIGHICELAWKRHVADRPQAHAA